MLSQGAAALGGGLNYLGVLGATRDPKAAKAVQESTEEALTYQPRTQYGREGVENLAKPFQKLNAFADQAGGKLADAGHPILGAAAKTAIEGAPMALPGAPKVLKPVARAGQAIARPLAEGIARAGEESAAVKAAAQAPRNAAISDAKDLGIRLPPSQAGGFAGRVAEGLSGPTRVAEEFSRANAPIVTARAAEDVGISPKEPIDQGIQRQVTQANQKYQVVRGFGRRELSDQYREDLKAVREQTSHEGTDFPEDVNEAVEKEIKKFDVPSADSNSMMTKIIKLRQRATRNIKTGDAEKAELGFAQKRIAKAMEDELERFGQETGQGKAVQEFREARRQLAKLHTLDESLSPSGVASAKYFHKALDRGEPLDGNMLKIARAYKSFEPALRDVKQARTLPFTVVDYLVGLGGFHNPALAAGVLARPLTRAVLGSKAYQAVAIKPRVPQPSLTSRAARQLAGPKRSPPLLEDLRE